MCIMKFNLFDFTHIFTKKAVIQKMKSFKLMFFVIFHNKTVCFWYIKRAHQVELYFYMDLLCNIDIVKCWLNVNKEIISVQKRE